MKSGDGVIVVLLRRPRKSDPKERRSDPFWEFGSFGLTRCHSRNLMNPRNAVGLSGVRLAFAQGGDEGFRLVHLTPPVEVVIHRNCIEATWSPHDMPFRYMDAPILVSNKAESDFKKLEASIEGVSRTTKEGRFSSRFRAGKTRLSDSLAREMVRVYDRKRSRSKASMFASSYDHALPWPPPVADEDRGRTYALKLDEARASGRRAGHGTVGCPKPHSSRRPENRAC